MAIAHYSVPPPSMVARAVLVSSKYTPHHSIEDAQALRIKPKCFIKKAQNIRESKKNAIEDGGWDGGSKLEGELFKLKARTKCWSTVGATF